MWQILSWALKLWEIPLKRPDTTAYCVKRGKYKISWVWDLILISNAISASQLKNDVGNCLLKKKKKLAFCEVKGFFPFFTPGNDSLRGQAWFNLWSSKCEEGRNSRALWK